MTGPRPLRETCVPRDEVLSGELREEMFAANLSEVARDSGHDIYRDPDLFFANTYLTERVRTFFHEVVGRLSGSDSTAAGFYRLDTPFGGGKTHTLIGLYHLLNSNPSAQSLSAIGLSPDNLLEQPVKVVTIVGGDLDPADGVIKDSVKVRHMWGEIAYQLGGAEGYGLVAAADANNMAPGPQFLQSLTGDKPVLIMIDEPAEYMRRMGPSAPQLPAFIKTLSEWVTAAGKPRALVMTLAWNPNREQGQTDAFAPETSDLVTTLADIFREVQSVTSRPAQIVTPAQSQDIEPILRQRLFKSVDMEGAAPAVAESYFSALREASERGATLTSEAVQGSYRDRLENAYPFHPSFIEALDGKLATIPNFQRTRGALRLVARVIRRMWEQGQNDLALIHPFCVDFADGGTVSELVGRLDRTAYTSVVNYDVANASGTAHAQEIDATSFIGHPPYTQRMATTLFLHSLPDPPARGANLSELLVANLTPGTDPAHLERALEYLSNTAWHLDSDENARYSFRVEPSLNKIVLGEIQIISQHEGRTEVERRIRQIWRTAGLEVRYFPESQEDVADSLDGRLLITHWDSAGVTASRNAVPTNVQAIADFKGTQTEFRRYRNTLFFLVADSDRTDRMVQNARKWLALDKLVRNRNRMDDLKLSADHRQRLRDLHKQGELDVRIAITSTYRHLFYPAGVNNSTTTLRHHLLSIDDQGSGQVNQTETILKALVDDLEQIKTAESALRAPSIVKNEAFGPNEGGLALDTLMERYAERPRLPLIVAPTYFKEVVKTGVINKTWLYYDGAANLAYDNMAPVTDIVLDADHMVMLPDEVAKQGISIWKPAPPLVTPKSVDDDDQNHDPPVPAPQRTSSIATAEGESRRALAEVLTSAQDGLWAAFGAISIGWSGEGSASVTSMSALRTLMGQISGGEPAVECSLVCEFGGGGQLNTEYRGSYQRYQSMSNTMETQAAQADRALVNLTISITYANGLAIDAPEIADLRDALGLVSLGHTMIEVHRHDGTG